MNLIATEIAGTYIVNPYVFEDSRGSFVKIYNREIYCRLGIDSETEEIFFSTSKKNVLRGFHFQAPPMEMEKIVWVTSGEILDVVLDLRKESRTYGKCFSITLSSDNCRAIFIPKGVAHAFCVLSDDATVIYQTSRVFSPEKDAGIRWDSAGYDWPITSPIVSDKDNKLTRFCDFESPF